MWASGLKRLIDIVASFLGIIFLAPLMWPIAAAVALSSPGGVFFRQSRVGLGGRLFSILKFRTMVAGAASSGPYFTDSGDPRVTAVGRFLRRTSLDELPQLINVLKGEMSLVGPRPDVPEQRHLYTEREWTLRHTVRPGVTGLAQATLRSDATVEQRKALDLEYVSSVTFALDWRIATLTVRQVVRVGSY